MTTMRESDPNNNNSFLPYTSTSCFDCGTKTTSLWRRDNLGNTVCNACRLYFLHHNRKRPISAIPHVIKRRNRKKNSTSKPKPPSPTIQSSSWPESNLRNPSWPSNHHHLLSQSATTASSNQNFIRPSFDHQSQPQNLTILRRESYSYELPSLENLNIGYSLNQEIRSPNLNSDLNNFSLSNNSNNEEHRSVNLPPFRCDDSSNIPMLPSLVNIIPYTESISAPVSANRKKFLPTDLEYYHYTPPTTTRTFPKILSDPVQEIISDTYPASFHSSPPMTLNNSMFANLRSNVLNLGLNTRYPYPEPSVQSPPSCSPPPPPSPH